MSGLTRRCIIAPAGTLRETALTASEEPIMATAAALIFHNHATAELALEAARSLEKSGDAKFLESGLLVKYQDLSVEMKKEGWKSELLVGTAAGGVIGALLIGVPVAGAIGGALAGTYVWKHTESHRAFSAFAEQVKHEMVPGGAAVVALVESTNPPHVHAALGRFGGTLFTTELAPVEIVGIQTELDKHKQ
jgi:uncharacterized membrane protein